MQEGAVEWAREKELFQRKQAELTRQLEAMRAEFNDMLAANSSQMGNSRLESSATSQKADLLVGKVLMPILEQVAESEEKEIYLQDEKGNLFRLAMCPRQAPIV